MDNMKFYVNDTTDEIFESSSIRSALKSAQRDVRKMYKENSDKDRYKEMRLSVYGSIDGCIGKYLGILLVVYGKKGFFFTGSYR